jgi:hypothetical protein
MARNLWGVIKCTFCLSSNPDGFDDIGRWIWTFPGKVRTVVAVGVSALIWSIWKTRNAVVFDRDKILDPGSVVHKISYWFAHWARLQKPNVRRHQIIAAQLLTKVALEAFSMRNGWAPARKRIAGS